MIKASLLLLFLFSAGCTSASIQTMRDRQAVGPPLHFAPDRISSRSAGNSGQLMVINWNVHVGHGRIRDLVEALAAKETAKGFPRPEFVLLLQEAFRRGNEVPSPEGTKPPRRIAPPEPGRDIEDVARELGWWMYYAPSMRNGGGQGEAGEDRGNAILSSLPLKDFEAVELPFVVQRRVALAATVTDSERGLRFRVAVAHLDTRAPLIKGWIFGGPPARNRQALAIARMLGGIEDSGLPLVLGGDLNTHFGPGEAAVRTVSQVATRKDCGYAATHTSGFVLDHVFVRTADDWPAPTCVRADQTFGSDHYPLILSFDMTRL